jgi:hypothetical protein
LSASCTGDNDWGLVSLAEGNHCCFCPYLINRIYNYRILFLKDFGHVFWRDEILDTGYCAVGVDGAYTFSHGLDLGLAIDIAKACICRLVLDSATMSRSIMEIRPTPERASASTTHDPTPPMPTTQTCALRRRRLHASWP